MNSKICFKCKVLKPIDEYYKHPKMGDGHIGKCKDCARKDAKIGTVPRVCTECGKNFMALAGEVKRRGGGAYTCSRNCYYKRLPKILEKKFDGKREYYGLHRWIARKRGKPSLCEFCGKTEGKFEWSNISGKYKEELTDWQRLCIKCHRNYDHAGTKAWITRRANMQNNTNVI